MTKEEFGGVIRAFVSAGFGFAVARGWMDAETAMTVGGAVGTLLIAAWSVRVKRA